MKRRGRIVLLCVLLLILVILCLVNFPKVIESTRFTADDAEVLLQQTITEQFGKGNVTNVTISSPICSEAVLGTVCRVDVNFLLDDKPAAGWCTFGLNQLRKCGIIGVINPKEDK